MKDLFNQMRLQAEDLHVLNPTSETVKCLSLGADALEALAAALAVKDEALLKWEDAFLAYKGAFDTPLERMRNDTEYAQDARCRMRELDEKMQAALAIQPHAALVAKIKSDAIREANVHLKLLDADWLVDALNADWLLAYADRIEKGEV